MSTPARCKGFGTPRLFQQEKTMELLQESLHLVLRPHLPLCTKTMPPKSWPSSLAVTMLEPRLLATLSSRRTLEEALSLGRWWGPSSGRKERGSMGVRRASSGTEPKRRSSSCRRWPPPSCRQTQSCHPRRKE